MYLLILTLVTGGHGWCLSNTEDHSSHMRKYLCHQAFCNTDYFLTAGFWKCAMCIISISSGVFWARRMNAVLAAKCAAAPGLPCERSERRRLTDIGPHSGGSAVAKHSLLMRSLAIKCGLWAKMALSWGQSSSFRAPHLARPLWEKPHLEFQLLLNLITHLDSH